MSATDWLVWLYEIQPQAFLFELTLSGLLLHWQRCRERSRRWRH